MMNSSTRWALRSAPLALVSLMGLGGCGGQDLETDQAVNPSGGTEEAASMPRCGTGLAAFDGTTAYSNGPDTGTGISCAGHGAYGLQYQCVELVMRHFRTHFGLSWYGNARDLLHNAPRGSVDVYGNGDGAHPPVPGDMIVWEVGQWGHVALVTAVHPGGVDIIEQNVGGNGHATLPYDGRSVGARWGNWVPAGWAHAKGNHAVPGGGGGGSGWSCGASAYNGQQYWTCSGGALNKCDGASPVRQACDRGCINNGLGRDDLCISGTGGWSCNKSAANGRQYWTCSSGSLYRCDGAGPTVVHCPGGCITLPVGTDDICR